jgi:hypothetical protein
MKMVFQCIAIGALLLLWGRWRDEAWLEPLARALVWVQLVSTLVSGAIYAGAARRAFRDALSEPENKSDGTAPPT